MIIRKLGDVIKFPAQNFDKNNGDEKVEDDDELTAGDVRHRQTGLLHQREEVVKTEEFTMKKVTALNLNVKVFSIFFKNVPSPASFIVYFRSFQTNFTIFATIYLKNVHPVHSAGIQTHDILDVIRLILCKELSHNKNGRN